MTDFTQKTRLCYQCSKSFTVGVTDEQPIFLLFCNRKCLEDYMQEQKQGIKNIAVLAEDETGNIIKLGDIKKELEK